MHWVLVASGIGNGGLGKMVLGMRVVLCIVLPWGAEDPTLRGKLGL